MKLIQSPVTFDPVKHEYWLGNIQLQGITGMLHEQLFPNKYAGIPEAVLQKAAERGTLIHQACEAADLFDSEGTCQESINYRSKCKELGWKHEASEYLVSDCEHWASCIDKVYRVDDTTFNLGDIKTTYQLDKESVRWQLSIYAYLFEQQNEGTKVDKLYGIWLRGDKCEFVEVQRVPSQEVQKLLLLASKGEQYVTPYTLPSEVAEMQLQVIEFDRLAKEYADKVKELKDRLLAMMDENGVTKWEGKYMTITRTADSQRKSLDSKALKEAYPEIYKQFEKSTLTKGSIRFTYKQ